MRNVNFGVINFVSISNEIICFYFLFFQASEIEPLNKEEEGEIKDDDSDKITMCQTKEELV